MRSLEARGSRATLSAVGKRRFEARQLDAHTVRLGEIDQSAEAAVPLRLVIGEDFGQAVIEKRIGESLDYGLEVSLRLVSHADRREHWRHFFGVERVKLRAHRCVGHRLADRQSL